MVSFTSVPSNTRGSPRRSASWPPLVEGPRWYRTRLRLWGPFAGLAVPAVVGALALVSLHLLSGPASGAIGLIGGVFAAPALLAAGAPFGSRDLYPLAVAASAVLWLAVGVVASRRATRNPVATWSDFWRHFAWLCAGIWCGAAIALGLAGLAISDSLF